MLKRLFSLLVFVALAMATGLQPSTALAGKRDGRSNPVEREYKPGGSDSDGDGQALVESAIQKRRGINFVTVMNVIVVQLLPDDNQGLRHQKFVVRLNNGVTITAVYNTDMGPYVPVVIGSVVSLAGQFISTGNGGLIHWLHHDPQGSRPDGWVLFNGTRDGMPQR